MTEEQKDWFDYGRKKAGWLIAKKLEPGREREITQIVWDARKKAHRWNKKGTCKDCAEFYPYSDENPDGDGRCAIGYGTWCTHTKSDATCNCFAWRKEQK